MNQRILTTALLFASLGITELASAETNQPLEQKLDQLSKQLEQVKAELKQVKSQNEALAEQQEKNAEKSNGSDKLSVTGYGELIYSRPTHQTENTKADLARAVFSLGYRFDDKTRLISEFESEHAVTSSQDSGEFEVEQFYIDHQVNNSIGIKSGLFLIRTGLINESHEPPRFYGVQRNFVETLIIPSTWREGGMGVHGTTQAGLGWDAGITTGMSMGGWEINPEVPRFTTADDLKDAGPFQATHQELSNAGAQHLSHYAALNYKGITGLTLGGSLFNGNMGKLQADTPDQTATLWELHTRWTKGNADISALYAQGRISNTEEVNQLYPGATNLIPAKFFGSYIQAAYTVWQQNEYHLTPYVRWENFNLADEIKGVATGASDGRTPTERVFTYGASFYLNPQVVVKMDFQTFKENSDFNRLNLGLGLEF